MQSFLNKFSKFYWGLAQRKKGWYNTLKYFYTNNKKGCAILRSANASKGYKDIEVKELQIQGVARKVIKSI